MTSRWALGRLFAFLLARAGGPCCAGLIAVFLAANAMNASLAEENPRNEPRAAEEDDREASEEEEYLERTLGKEKELILKKQERRDTGRGGDPFDKSPPPQEPGVTSEDPEKIQTEDTAIGSGSGSGEDELDKEQQFASGKYIEGQFNKKLAQLEGKVPSEYIDQYLVYTPSPAAKKNPRIKKFEQERWNQKVREYKQAKLGSELLAQVDEEFNFDPSSLPDELPQGATAKAGGGSGSGTRTGSDSKGAEAGSKAGGKKGAGGGEGKSQAKAGGKEGRATKSKSRGGSSQGSQSDPAKSAGQSSRGQVALGEPPAAGQGGGSKAFSDFVAQSGIGGTASAGSGKRPGTSSGKASSGKSSSGQSSGEASGQPADPSRYPPVPPRKPVQVAQAGRTGSQAAGDQGTVEQGAAPRTSEQSQEPNGQAAERRGGTDRSTGLAQSGSGQEGQAQAGSGSAGSGQGDQTATAAGGSDQGQARADPSGGVQSGAAQSAKAQAKEGEGAEGSGATTMAATGSNAQGQAGQSAGGTAEGRASPDPGGSSGEAQGSGTPSQLAALQAAGAGPQAGQAAGAQGSADAAGGEPSDQAGTTGSGENQSAQGSDVAGQSSAGGSSASTDSASKASGDSFAQQFGFADELAALSGTTGQQAPPSGGADNSAAAGQESSGSMAGPSGGTDGASPSARSGLSQPDSEASEGGQSSGAATAATGGTSQAAASGGQSGESEGASGGADSDAADGSSASENDATSASGTPGAASSSSSSESLFAKLLRPFRVPSPPPEVKPDAPTPEEQSTGDAGQERTASDETSSGSAASAEQAAADGEDVARSDGATELAALTQQSGEANLDTPVAENEKPAAPPGGEAGSGQSPFLAARQEAEERAAIEKLLRNQSEAAGDKNEPLSEAERAALQRAQAKLDAMPESKRARLGEIADGKLAVYQEGLEKGEQILDQMDSDPKWSQGRRVATYGLGTAHAEQGTTKAEIPSGGPGSKAKSAEGLRAGLPATGVPADVGEPTPGAEAQETPLDSAASEAEARSAPTRVGPSVERIGSKIRISKATRSAQQPPSVPPSDEDSAQRAEAAETSDSASQAADRSAGQGTPSGPSLWDSILRVLGVKEEPAQETGAIQESAQSEAEYDQFVQRGDTMRQQHDRQLEMVKNSYEYFRSLERYDQCLKSPDCGLSTEPGT